MTLKTIYLMVCTLIVAGISHIAIVLLIPEYGSKDAWNLISKSSDLWSFRVLNPEGQETASLEDIDPYFTLGACTFDLDQSALRMSGLETKSFWSISIFDQDGRVVYSMNSRTAIENKLDLLLLNPVQMVALRENPTVETERSIIVEAPIAKGFVILRIFSPQSRNQSGNSGTAQLSAVSCETYT